MVLGCINVKNNDKTDTFHANNQEVSSTNQMNTNKGDKYDYN